MPFMIKNPHLSFIQVKLRGKTISIAPGKVKGPFPDRDLTDEARSKAGQRKIVVFNYIPLVNKVADPFSDRGRRATRKKDKKLKDRGDKTDE